MNNIFLVLSAIGVFGFYDYVGFNTIKPMWIYRVSQFILFVGMCVGLYSLNGWPPMVGFFILHQTWWADLFYYLLFDTFQWYGGDYAGSAFRGEVTSDKVTWAWWTPYGIFFRLLPGKKDIPIAGRVLIWQAVIGMIVAITLMAVWR
jgi:hypothetical protein